MRMQEDVWVAPPLENAWALLTDLRRTASCLPEAYLDEVVDGEYRGSLQAGSGAAPARYAGTACFVGRDEVDHRAAVQAASPRRGRYRHDRGRTCRLNSTDDVDPRSS